MWSKKPWWVQFRLLVVVGWRWWDEASLCCCEMLLDGLSVLEVTRWLKVWITSDHQWIHALFASEFRHVSTMDSMDLAAVDETQTIGLCQWFVVQVVAPSAPFCGAVLSWSHWFGKSKLWATEIAGWKATLRYCIDKVLKCSILIYWYAQKNRTVLEVETNLSFLHSKSESVDSKYSIFILQCLISIDHPEMCCLDPKQCKRMQIYLCHQLWSVLLDFLHKSRLPIFAGWDNNVKQPYEIWWMLEEW